MSKTVRAVRGATTVDADAPDQITVRVQELIGRIIELNELEHDDIISIVITATSDIKSMYPATAARSLGLDDVPLLGAQELTVDAMVPHCIRLMAHVESDRAKSEIHHVYLHGARVLRADLADK